MTHILRAIYFTQLCCHALGTLPAPVNVTIESRNFDHNLRWDPGPGTPEGTTYRVIYSGCRKNKEINVPDSSVDKVKQTLRNCTSYAEDTYTISVKAVNGGVESPWSNYTFTPYTDTVLGPPEVSVTGCGGCLNLTITLPRGNARSSITEIYMDFNFHIFWKRAGNTKVWNTSTSKSSYVLQHLAAGVEYCVRVQPQLNVNKHTLSSNWTCAFSSPVKQSRSETSALLILACLSAPLIVGGLVLMGLFYTGFLCKLKTHLPTVLTSLVGTHYLLADRNSPLLISVISEVGGRGRGKPERPQPVRDGSDEEEDEEEEEEGGNDGYENHAAGLSGGTRSGGTRSSGTSHDASDSTVSLTTASAADSSGISDRMAPQEPPSLGDRFQGEREEPGPQEQGGEADLEHSEDVNLLSVILGALQEDEDEEEGGGEDEGGVAESTGELQRKDGSDECLLLLSPGGREGPLVGQSDSPGLGHTASPLLTHSDCRQTPSHYLQTRPGSAQTHTDSTLEEEDEEEEDQDCSGYMRR
ncbi:hypothetical protein MATL_G00179130 [Megalops atlanticus]|uniref:Fibronectin type-III domain-containing protein n=1 Tax=Megalops atlanticus TaxID=7932 RepID=A0A9D3PP36_MEGAT|nr:hypothetical protein MATL_G00179130 [Megalops atlanticus]